MYVWLVCDVSTVAISLAISTQHGLPSLKGYGQCMWICIATATQTWVVVISATAALNPAQPISTTESSNLHMAALLWYKDEYFILMSNSKVCFNLGPLAMFMLAPRCAPTETISIVVVAVCFVQYVANYGNRAICLLPTLFWCVKIASLITKAYYFAAVWFKLTDFSDIEV